MDLWEIFPFTPEVGYLGLTIVSFFGSLVPFVPVPSFVLLVTMAGGTQFDIHILAIIGAVAATAAKQIIFYISYGCLLYTSPSPRDATLSRMPSSA